MKGRKRKRKDRGGGGRQRSVSAGLVGGATDGGGIMMAPPVRCKRWCMGERGLHHQPEQTSFSAEKEEGRRQVERERVKWQESL